LPPCLAPLQAQLEVICPLSAQELVDHLVSQGVLRAERVQAAGSRPPGLFGRGAAAAGPAACSICYFADLERVAAGGFDKLEPPVQRLGTA
jgi:hypothetical protein